MLRFVEHAAAVASHRLWHLFPLGVPDERGRRFLSERELIPQLSLTYPIIGIIDLVIDTLRQAGEREADGADYRVAQEGDRRSLLAAGCGA